MSIFSHQCFIFSVTQGTDKGLERETYIHADTYLPYRQQGNKHKLLVIAEKVLTVGLSRAAGTATTLRAGQFRVQTPVDPKFLHLSSPALGPIQPLYSVYGYSARGAVSTTQPHLKPRLKKEHNYNSTTASVSL